MHPRARGDLRRAPRFASDEHRAIAKAIRAGDRELTDSLLVAHMDDAVNRLIPN